MLFISKITYSRGLERSEIPGGESIPTLAGFAEQLVFMDCSMWGLLYDVRTVVTVGTQEITAPLIPFNSFLWKMHDIAAAFSVQELENNSTDGLENL